MSYFCLLLSFVFSSGKFVIFIITNLFFICIICLFIILFVYYKYYLFFCPDSGAECSHSRREEHPQVAPVLPLGGGAGRGARRTPAAPERRDTHQCSPSPV